jgi:hypothetical protein
MKIHLVRFMKDSLPDEASPLPVWHQLIERSGTRNIFTDDPCSADRIIFIDLHQAHHLNVRKTVVEHPLFKEHRQKILVWNETDRPVFDLRGLYVNVPVGLTLDPTIIPIPYLFVPADSLFHGTNFSKGGRSVTCTYRGSNTHKCRKVLTAINHPNYSLVDSTHSNSISESNYVAELDRSVHVLCPRGHGLTSFRLYEAMARGCMPTIVADGWFPPKGIAWDTFCTFVKESDIECVPNHLNYSESELSKRQESLAQEYNAYLAPDVRMSYFLKQISDVPFGDCISMSPTAQFYSINLKVRKKVMSLKGLILGR